MKKANLPAGYVPALRVPWLTSIYDPVVKWTTRESTVKKALLQQASLAPDMKVLDLACGTGTLALLIKHRFPNIDITGIDGDEEILRIAQSKADSRNANIQFDCGLATQLPYENSSFDRVFSSLFFHHLNTSDKQRTLVEAYRVLKPGGQLHIADWGKSTNFLMRLLFYQIQLLDGFSNTKDNVDGWLPQYMQNAGFCNIANDTSFNTVFGTLALFGALKAE